MPKKEDKRDRLSGLFGLDPTLGLGDKVIDHIEEAQKEEERKRVEKDGYYAFCPNCGRKQIRENLLENGCFVCGWKGMEEDLELAQTKRQSKASLPGLRGENLGYKTKCPNCGASLVTEEFLQNGCWRCGYKG